MPEGWNKTLDDLDFEYRSGARSSLGSPEVDWARDYEKSLLPAGTRFPNVGDIYEAIEDVEIRYLTSWDAPFSGGGKGKVLVGERIVVRYMLPEPIAVSAAPVNYSEVEARLVPASERALRGYSGYALTIKTVDLNSRFRLVTEAGAAISNPSDG